MVASWAESSAVPWFLPLIRNFMDFALAAVAFAVIAVVPDGWALMSSAWTETPAADL